MPLEIKRNRSTGHLHIVDEAGNSYSGIDGSYTTYSQANTAISRFYAKGGAELVDKPKTLKKRETKTDGKAETAS